MECYNRAAKTFQSRALLKLENSATFSCIVYMQHRMKPQIIQLFSIL